MKSPPRCLTCLSPVEHDAVYCPGCRTAYHEACYKQTKCVMDGCPALLRKRRVVSTPSSSWLWKWAAMFGVLFLVSWGVTSALASGPGHLITRIGLASMSLIALAGLATSVAACVHKVRMPAGDGRRADYFGTLSLGLHMSWWLVLAVAIFVENFVIYLHGSNAQAVIAAFWLCFGLGVLASLVGVFADREKGRAGNILGTTIFLGVGFAVILTPIPRAGQRSYTRACYANQKTIAGAMEMYNLDRNTRRNVLDAGCFTALKSGGYLQSIPQDPGEGPGTSGHYRVEHTGKAYPSLTCEVHGSIQ